MDSNSVSNPEAVRVKLPRLTKDEIQEILRTRNDLPALHFVFSVVLVFVPSLLVFAYHAMPPLPQAYEAAILAGICVFSILLNLHVFNRFAQIVHGSDHIGLFSSRRLNILVGIVAGAFLGYTRDGHKQAHQEHHSFLNTPKDADRIWCDPAAPASSVFKLWLNDIFLVSAIRRFLQYFNVKDRKVAATETSKSGLLRNGIALLPAVAIHLLILASYWLAGGVEYYFLLFILPLATLYPAQIRLRSNVEHCFDNAQVRPEDIRVTRSVKGNWLERFVMAPLYIEYHFEHHIMPNMPYYNAPRFREILRLKGFDVPIAQGYFAFMWQKYRREMKAQYAAA